jgi:DNA (cytosine-5)-methyltransferase 1
MIITDLFCGGGGASVGMEVALGADVTHAINHDEVAIAVHTLNHPRTEHWPADIWETKPRDVTKGREIDVLWASPDCSHHSRAKGGRPREQKIRSLAWVITDWAEHVHPRVIFVENVREFEFWGPLLPDGQPDPNRKGETFHDWVRDLESFGYEVEWRVLDSAQFGAPTRRHRIFVVARCDGLPIRWPQPTHGTAPGLQPERTAAECIDWTLPIPSIFDRPKPLAEKTLTRIAAGIWKYVLRDPHPFIVRVGDECIAPSLIQTGYGERPGQAPRTLDINKPLGTVVACGQKHGLVAAFLAKHYGGVVGHDLNRPIGTITAKDHHSVVAAALNKPFGGGRDHRSEVRAFLMSYYGQGTGQALFNPLRTITTKDRFGIVLVEGVEYEIVDIGMRMLQPNELLLAQFGDFANGYKLDAFIPSKGRNVCKTEKVRLVGNSVPPNVVHALVKENMAA